MKKVYVATLISIFVLFSFQDISFAKHCVVGSPNFQKCVCKHHPNRSSCKRKMRQEYLAQTTGDVCSIQEGTYVGKALVNGQHGTEKWPLFIVAANKRITGFYAPEDQMHPQGASINQDKVDSGFKFFITTTSKGEFLNFNVPGSDPEALPRGKAKLIKPGGVVAFMAYYLPRDTFNSGSIGDFVNIANDGSLVARLTASRNFNFFFGQINKSGKFIQVFPDDGPKLEITFYGLDLDVVVTSPDGKKEEINLEDNSQDTCSAGTGTSSDPGTVLGNALLVEGFKENLESYANAFDGLFEAIGSKAKAEQGLANLAEKINKNFNKIRGTERCKVVVGSLVIRFGNGIKNLEKDLCSVFNNSKCIPDDVATGFIASAKSALDKMESAFNIDDDENGIPDLCD